MTSINSIAAELENEYFMIIDSLADLFWDIVIRTYHAVKRALR